ncbi:alpha/beta fold hydrolase [Membranihabitans maritimus]|uniref:alpha/beta fold hydrolase n=1 Tax=Membranihabitans maritimus TaxID=2904244 RepID=UPI001F01FEB6|nr:alpha/beta fold hydrolase [Membranihabitans maritimus]
MQLSIKPLVFITLSTLILGLILSFSSDFQPIYSSNTMDDQSADTTKRKELLRQIVNLLPPDRPGYGRVSYLDSTFNDWLKRTGELPPDFDKMPSIPSLPDPLTIDEGNKNIPVKTMEQWKQKREWMKEQLQYYITGTFPPAPDNLKSKIISEKMDGEVKVQMIELSFGPSHQAKLTLELMIPPGTGPFPVFMSQWNHREWAQIAVRRGYIGCIYAGADRKDDTEDYSRIWAGEYDFTRLMRRAYGCFRAIDYLYTLPFVDRDKIGLTGHSRNGKQSLMAAAFDERITAVITSSGGTGAEVPWRYCSQPFDVEDIALLACAQPSWLHPRLRFFIGREEKLPVDQNHFMALIAPRGLMLSTAINEVASNPWGIEQAYKQSKKVYDFLGDSQHIAVRNRYGKHSVSARDLEDYIDFFDYVFGRSEYKPTEELLYPYSFEKWKERTGEDIDPMDFPDRSKSKSILKNEENNISSITQWEKERKNINKTIQWILGEKPAGVTNPGPGTIKNRGRGEESFGHFLQRPEPTEKMGKMPVSPYDGFGDNLFGYLYYPKDKVVKNAKLPVIIYLHEFDYSKGFTSMGFDHEIQSYFETLVDKGFAVFSFDMLGFGNRIEEGSRFYERYPRWSKMGKMVTDVQSAVDALSNMDEIDENNIYVTGYSLGGTVGLLATAIDERIAGVASSSGFVPWRTPVSGSSLESVKAYSHYHGLLPRLGFFIGQEGHIPVDFNEIIASIAPRPVLIVAPSLQKNKRIEDIENTVLQAGEIFQLQEKSGNLQFASPEDYDRFAERERKYIYKWISGLEE